MVEERGAWRSLRLRNYRLYWLSQVASQLGIWIRLIGMSWLVLDELGGGGTVVGFVAAAQFVPMLVLGPWAGLLSDRVPPLRVLRITQSAMVVINLALVGVLAAGAMSIPLVYVFAATSGIVVAFDNPTRQAMVGELVPPPFVANAVALNSVGFNGARIIGPALAGGLIALGGLTFSFTVVAVAYGIAFLGILRIDAGELTPRQRAVAGRGQIREGVRYVLSVESLRTPLLVLAVVGTLSMNFTVLVPLLAKSLTSSAGAFGLISASIGVGSLIGSVVVARRIQPTVADLAAAAGGLAAGMALVAVLPGAFAVVALMATGFSSIAFLTTTNSLLQLHARPELRGRVLSLYSVLVVGTSPVGSPMIGWIADRYGVRSSVLVGAFGAAVGAVIAAIGARHISRRRD